MKKSYRLALEALYADALKAHRITVKKVTSHRDASATIPTTEKITAAVKKIAGVEILAEGSTEITFRIPAAVAYHTQHPPLMTDAERTAAAEEKEKRQKERERKRAEATELAEDMEEEFGEDGSEGLDEPEDENAI